jgi:hypothetical protein
LIDLHFVLLGAFISLLGGLGYLYGTLAGRVQPNRVSWFMWALAPLVAFAAELQEGVGLQSLMTFMVGIVPLLIVAASFVNRGSAWRITRFDLVCGGLSLAGVGLWALTRSGDVAIVFAILADALAAVPTFVKAAVAPESEGYTPYLGGSISAAITLLTVTDWTFANYAFPLYILAIGLLLTVLVKFRLGRLVKPEYRGAGRLR